MKKVLRMPLILGSNVTPQEVETANEGWMDECGCDPMAEPYVHFAVKGKSVVFRTAHPDYAEGEGPQPSLDDAIYALTTAFEEHGDNNRKVELVDGDEADGVIIIS